MKSMKFANRWEDTHTCISQPFKQMLPRMVNVYQKFVVRHILIERKNFTIFLQRINLMTPTIISKKNGRMKCLTLMESQIISFQLNQTLMKMKDKSLVWRFDMIGI